MTKEALKLALEALEEAWYHVGTFQPTEKAIDLYDEARTAIKEALAQPEQDPVAWMVWGENNVPSFTFKKPSDKYVFDSLYITPPQRQPLTYEQLDSLWQNIDTGDFELDIREFARAVEAAHGIKDKNTRGQE